MPKALIVLLAAASLAGWGCRAPEGGDGSVAPTDAAPFANQPPTITLQGPDFPGAEVQITWTAWGSVGEPPKLAVVVGDPDGLEDIAAVLLDVELVTLDGLIVRRGAIPAGACGELFYADGNVIDVAPFIPAQYPGPSLVPLTRLDGGLYETPPFCVEAADCLMFQGFIALTDALGAPVSGCFVANTTWIFAYGVYPPAVTTPADGFLTLADLVYSGITITVYDSVGQTAVATFPDLRVVHTTDEELIWDP